MWLSFARAAAIRDHAKLKKDAGVLQVREAVRRRR